MEIGRVMIGRARNCQRWTEIEIEMTEIDRWQMIVKEIVIVIMIVIVIVTDSDSDWNSANDSDTG